MSAAARFYRELLVSICHEKGVKVCAVPGPTAFATAVAVSGLSTGRFTFEGFLSVNKKSRREHLEEIVNETRTLVFYEAPHKLSATLKDMAQVLGDRRIAIVRELTKIHEEIIRTTLKKAAEDYANGEIKGEIVLVIEGAKKQKLRWTLEDAVKFARRIQRFQPVIKPRNYVGRRPQRNTIAARRN